MGRGLCNGDRKADVCGRGIHGIYCALSTGTDFGPATLWTTSFSDAGGWRNDPSYWQTIRFPDLNGDGKADVCGRSGAGIKCGLNTGTGFGIVTLWASEFSDPGGWKSHPSYWSTIQFADLNQDGKADVCGRGVLGINCGLSTGTTFGGVTLWTESFSDAGFWNSDPAYYGTIRLANVSLDGAGCCPGGLPEKTRADVCGRGYDGIWCGVSTGSSFSAPTLWVSEFSNPNAWATDPSFWSTIQYVNFSETWVAGRLANFTYMVCGRGSAGILCADMR